MLSYNNVLCGSCEECKLYYEAYLQQGLGDREGSGGGGEDILAEVLQRCSRHKAKWAPPSTPEGFWDLTFHTPTK